MKKEKIGIYPYDDEFYPILNNWDLVVHYEVGCVYMPRGWSNGKKFVETKNGKIKISTDLNDIEQVESMWIVETQNKIEDEELIYAIDYCITKKKNIIISRNMKKSHRENIILKCKNNGVCFIDCNSFLEKEKMLYDTSSKVYSSLREIHTPVIAVTGVGERCGKFETEIELMRELERRHYKVSLVASRGNIGFLGCHSFPTFMLNSGLDECKKIFFYNSYINLIEKKEQPDIIIIGVPGGIMPITKQHPEHFGVLSFEIFNAVQPDYVVMSLYNDDFEERYFSKIKELMKFKFSVEVDSFLLSKCAQDPLSINTNMPIKYIEYSDIEVKHQCEKFADINIFGSYNVKNLAENIIDSLSGYCENEIL